MIKIKRNIKISFLLIILLLILVSFQSYSSIPLPPKPLYGTASRSDGGSTIGASVVVSASGLPNEYYTIEGSGGGWVVDISGDTGVEWPDGTFFTVTITMTGWFGTKTGYVVGTYTNVGNVVLYPYGGPLSADAGDVYYGVVYEEIEFYGLASGGVTPYLWLWDFGDGDNSNIQNPTHKYLEPGTYIVILTVTDNIEQTATDLTNAVISGDSNIIVDANGPYEGLIEEEIQFKGDVKGGMSPYSWLWDFGDGTSSDGQNPVHIFTELGEYNVILTVSDKNLDNGSDETICKINIDNEPPIKPLISGLSEGKSGEEYEYNFVTLDPEKNDVYYFIEWGDEIYDGWLGPYESGQSINVIHVWDEEGFFVIKAKTKDIYGAESDWGIFEVEMPKDKLFNDSNPWLFRLINLFPILEFLL